MKKLRIWTLFTQCDYVGNKTKKYNSRDDENNNYDKSEIIRENSTQN